MKSVIIIRQCRLSDPYSDYTTLSLQQLRGLGTGHIDPDIHPDGMRMVSERFTSEHLQAFDMILCAPSRRARQTAELIKHLSQKNLEIKQTDTLKEIYFDLAALTNEEQFAQNGLQEVRSALYRGVVQKESGAESLEKLLRRTDTLLEILEQIQYKTILCVTHSFFMRVLRLCFLEHLTHSRDITIGQLMQAITVDQLMNAHDHSYLDGFTIPLEKDSAYYERDFDMIASGARA